MNKRELFRVKLHKAEIKKARKPLILLTYLTIF